MKKEDVASKIVILTTRDNYTGTIKHPYARFGYEEDKSTNEYFSYGSYLLNVYANLKDREYVHEPSRTANIFWIFIFCFCNLSLLMILQQSPKKYIILSFLIIPIEFLMGLLTFYFTNVNFDFSRILVVQLLIQYVGIPVILINYLRRSDAEKIAFQKKAEREKVKMKFALKVAEAEVLMKIAAKVSHDLRGPIMALQIASEYLKGRVEPEVGSLIVESAARVRHIADDTLKAYRNEKSEKILPVVNVLEVLKELIASYRQIYPQVLFHIADDGFFGVQIPFYSLQRSISNILNNAIEAGGTEVSIRIRSFDESVQVIIANNGPQIPDEVRKKLFQERATFGKEAGTGLGLYQVRKEVESYGGSVALDTEEKTAFIISMPKELRPFVVELADNVWVLERNSDVGALLASVPDVQALSISNLNEGREMLRKWTGSEPLVLVDISFEDGENTAFDFLELINGSGLGRVLLFSTIIDHTEIQKIADSYGVQLVEKWRLINSIENLAKP
ncbi:sensor histidine kinase [Bdellovibrio bacteriovorus]|uniref:sensor histidine kinase n=1 Tax=Bdellovibrio bacteriovorus TaxID=959 RepID=UPI0012FBE013|nr:HAMP domain-containing sensor histidine kinase [Bdellovibrio bacteriovorus]